MDNLITGSTDNISHIRDRRSSLHPSRRHGVHLSLRPPEYVLHFASPASPADYYQYPIQTMKVGSLGTHKALGLAKEKKARFLLASTSEVYGDPSVHPQPESYPRQRRHHLYARRLRRGEALAEALTMAYHRHHGSTRDRAHLNTYGPRMRLDDGRALSNFIRQALTGEDMTVFGEGRQTRSFCYVTDLIEASSDS